MIRTTLARSIKAPVEVVFDTVAHIDNFRQAIPHVIDVEFLSDVRSGVGARFKETRDMNGRKATVELEIAEYDENKLIRLVSDSGGTVWNTVFTTESAGDGTNLTMAMDSKPYKVPAKLMNPLMTGMIRKAIERDMDAVKSYCEGQAS